MPIGRDGGSSTRDTDITITGGASANSVPIPSDAVDLVVVARHSSAVDTDFIARVPTRTIEAQTAGSAGDTTYPAGTTSGETIGVKVRRKAGGTIRLDRLSSNQTLAAAWWSRG